ncbi:hypothetical protein Tco_0956143 [Tanacetum coccineum]|uniref:DUF8039 domain-containing protein n=1 Tax=Tanacetum coccineum TaxID=301880 RepID=A0ABQ5E967_9ASTR
MHRIIEETNDSKMECRYFMVEIQADDHDLLVNSNNENDDMLGYESEKYSDVEDADRTNHAEDADGTNHSDLKLVKRGITRLYKFRREYGKPGGIKIKVTFDALNRVSGLHRALFSSFLGDLVREHIGLKILSWKKVDKESRDKLWDEITRYFDVDLTVRNLVMHRLGKMLRNFRMKLREKYILPNLNTPSKLNELPAKYSAIVIAKEWVGVTPMGAYEVDRTQSSVVVRDKDARIKEKSNGLVTSEKEPIKTVGPKKTPKSRRNGSQDSQLQGNASKCKLWHLKKSNIVALGTVYKSAGKQMLHNQALPNDCYKVSIDSSLVDAACIPDNQVVLDEEVTPPTTIQKISDYNSAPKLLQSKRKSYVSRETMQRQARTGKSHKSLNYGS